MERLFFLFSFRSRCGRVIFDVRGLLAQLYDENEERKRKREARNACFLPLNFDANDLHSPGRGKPPCRRRCALFFFFFSTPTPQKKLCRNNPVFSKLAEAGIEVRAHDCVGHGTSVSNEGGRGLVPRYSYLVEDLRAAAARAAEERAGVPLFLGGHSMGGLIATLTALGGGEGGGGGEEGGEKEPPPSSSAAAAATAAPVALPPLPPLSGLFLSSPALDVEWTPILKAQAPIGGLLSLLMPRARVVPAVDPRHLCRDEAVVAAYRVDPLNFVGNVRARTANELLRAFKAVVPLAPKLSVPALVIFGDADKIASFPAAKKFVDAAREGPAKPDARLVVFPGAFHELFFGPDKDEAVRLVVEWIEKNSTGGREKQAKM